MKQKLHNIHDKSYKSLYSKKEIALDLFKNFLNKDLVKDLTLENLTLINKSFISADFEESEADIVYKADIDGTEVIFYILLEFQSTIDYRMPVRLLFYMSELLRDFAKNNKLLKSDKNIKIPAVIPIVLYNGEDKWDAKVQLKDMYYGKTYLSNDILNFKYELIDVNNNFTKEELVENKNATSAIFLLDQKIDLFEFLNRITQIALFFNSLTDEQLKAIKNWIRNTIEKKIADVATGILEGNKEEVTTMVANNAFIYTEGLEKSRIEGERKGKLEGKIEDIIEALQEKELEVKGLKEQLYKINDLDKLKRLYKYVLTIDNIDQFNNKLEDFI